jgi:hypothetical protein
MQNTTISNRSRHSFTIGDLEINGFGDMKRWDAQRDHVWCGYVEFRKSTSSLVASRVAARLIGNCATRDDYKRIFFNAGVLSEIKPEL